MSKSLIKLLDQTSSLFLDLPKAKSLYKSLTDEDFKYISEVLGDDWKDLSVDEQIIHICRGYGGTKIRKTLEQG